MCAKWGDKLINRLEGRAGIQRAKQLFAKPLQANILPGVQMMWAAFCTQWVNLRTVLCMEQQLLSYLWLQICVLRVTFHVQDVLWCSSLRARRHPKTIIAEVSHWLVLAAWFRGVGSWAVTIKTNAMGLAPLVTAAHGWKVHPLSTGPCPLLPFLPVLPYSLSLASESAFLFLVAHL